jgi:hypothetical protein
VRTHYWALVRRENPGFLRPLTSGRDRRLANSVPVAVFDEVDDDVVANGGHTDRGQMTEHQRRFR